jgi:threonine dehydrogenase-like Zn-dependent dehydrogenase
MHGSASNYIMLAAFVASLSVGQQQQQPLQAIATHHTTVIAGAGVIGLSSAYHLALVNR